MPESQSHKNGLSKSDFTVLGAWLILKVKDNQETNSAFEEQPFSKGSLEHVYSQKLVQTMSI